eukprot:TRINITY_DN17543_c0_g1_i1.p1 TRINITY_DN17543_c0_g1~~TRINITY_DN17543_c0_g1_i1.p1  ORF type:complete len:142 (-),score=9.19 TRINITY_DN17543_c0_g1_i1:73-498(-)
MKLLENRESTRCWNYRRISSIDRFAICAVNYSAHVVKEGQRLSFGGSQVGDKVLEDSDIATFNVINPSQDLANRLPFDPTSRLSLANEEDLLGITEILKYRAYANREFSMLPISLYFSGRVSFGITTNLVPIDHNPRRRVW